MAITDSTGTFTSGILIGDQTSGYPVTPTVFGGSTISSCLELKSTTTAFTLPRMTTAQIDELPNTVDGMMAYNSDSSSAVCRSSGIWTSVFSVFKVATVILNQAEILALNVTPITLVTAPGPGLAVIVLKATFANIFNTTAFAAGDVVTVGYETSGNNALTATIDAAFVNTAGPGNVIASLYGVNGGTAGDIILASDIDNQAINISTDIAFTGGNAASKIECNVWYTTVAVA